MEKQIAALFTKTGAIQVELPSAKELLINGIPWGSVDAFPTPAYWQYQVVARRLTGKPINYKLGRSLKEEVAACLLEGHGIRASVGMAAFERLRDRGAFSNSPPSQEQLEQWLREPLKIGGRQVRYRFAAQKARYISAALPFVQTPKKFNTGKKLRDWLLQIKGIGPKTASMIARNWMDANDVAILDIHILRVCQFIGLFPIEATVERHYFKLEELFLKFSQALDVHASELDAVIWYEMASSPKTAKAIISKLRELKLGTNPIPKRKKNPHYQIRLI